MNTFMFFESPYLDGTTLNKKIRKLELVMTSRDRDYDPPAL